MGGHDLRRGVTLIEVLIVLGIMTLLAAILIPAVQYAREASRRAQCINNLRQIGIGLSSYSSNFGGTLPKSYNGFSFYVFMLPYIEQSPLFHSINVSYTRNSPPSLTANSTTADVRLDVLCCPSDGQFGTTGNANYAGNLGCGLKQFGANGVFNTNGGGPINVASITDGMSNTSAVAEWLLGPSDSSLWAPKRSVFIVKRSTEGSPDFDGFVAACNNLNASTARPQKGKGRDWLNGNLYYTYYNHIIIPGGPSCMPNGAVQSGAFTSGSAHADGANVLFADGHTRFIESGIAIETWRAIGSRNGNEVIPQDGG